MIVSAPASAALHVPVVSLAPSPDSQDSPASKTIAFKNVFDSLTLFDDLENGGGAEQQGAALPKSTAKKDPSADSGSGTEEAVVPQAPSGKLPKPSLNLQPAATLSLSTLGVGPEAPGAGTVPLDVATATSTAPVPTPTATNAQATGKAQTTAPSTSEATNAPVPKPVQKEAIQDQGLLAQAAQPETAPRGDSLPTGKATRTVQAAQLPTNPAPQSNAVATAAPVNATQPPQASGPGISASAPQTPTVQAPVNNSSATLPPQASGPGIRASAPQTPRIKAPVNHSSAMASNFIAAQTPPASALRIRASGPASVTAPSNKRTPIATSPPESSSPQAVVPPQPAQTIQLAPPAPRQPESSSALPAETTARTTSATESIVPASTLSPGAPEAVAAPTSLPAPLPMVREIMDRTSESSKPIVVEHEALAVTPAPKIPLLPQAGNFAFALRMFGLESSSVTTSETPVTPSEIPVTPAKGSVAPSQPSTLQQPLPPINHPSSAPQRETPSSSPQTEPKTEKPNAGVQNRPDLLKAPPTPEVIPHLNETAVFQAPQPGSFTATPEPTEAAHPNLPLAVQEAHFIAPELPKTSTSSEILLHLTGNNESSAAIRIADRAGSVNVSVHASDPVLRESLRSNLGELSTQLNAQGWKADVVKSAAAAIATHSESQQESHTNGQRGSQQQQSSGERQPQRDRRANGGQWQQELDQQITGGDAHPGGNR